MNLTRRRLITQGATALTTSLALTTPLPLIAKPLTPSPTKLLFDTDIGSDIDDAVALAYLLMQPSIDLLGITTCLLYTSPSPRDGLLSRMPSSA